MSLCLHHSFGWHICHNSWYSNTLMILLKRKQTFQLSFWFRYFWWINYVQKAWHCKLSCAFWEGRGSGTERGTGCQSLLSLTIYVGTKNHFFLRYKRQCCSSLILRIRGNTMTSFACFKIREDKDSKEIQKEEGEDNKERPQQLLKEGEAIKGPTCHWWSNSFPWAIVASTSNSVWMNSSCWRRLKW